MLLALCLAPMLGRMHQVVHMPAWLALVAGSQATAEGGAAGSNAPDAHATPAPSLASWSLPALFAHHGALDCQSLDQLAHGQAPLHVAVWLPDPGATGAPCLPLAAGVPSSCNRCFDARAPPQCPVPFHA